MGDIASAHRQIDVGFPISAVVVEVWAGSPTLPCRACHPPACHLATGRGPEAVLTSRPGTCARTGPGAILDWETIDGKYEPLASSRHRNVCAVCPASPS